MILPTVIGKINQPSFFIFTACDTLYFDDFAKVLINSILKNTNIGVHVHIFNPREDQLLFCQKDSRISVSHEVVPVNLFESAALKWKIEPTDSLEKTRYDRILTSMAKGKDKSVIERLQKTYFACARFIRLEQLTKSGDKFFAMDVDAIVRKDIPLLPEGKDCYLHKIIGKKARILAGGLYSNGTTAGRKFLEDYSGALTTTLINDYLYWSLDQDILDTVVPKFNIGDLPISLIDWEMRPNSAVWTAKGVRKDLEIFIAEQTKYRI